MCLFAYRCFYFFEKKNRLDDDGIDTLHLFRYSEISQDKVTGVISVRGDHNGEVRSFERNFFHFTFFTLFFLFKRKKQLNSMSC